MDSITVSRLLDLNHRFYQTFAVQFSITRQRLQPGVQKLIKTIPSQESLLDLGCGNGELARAFLRQGHTGPYVGLDFSEKMLAQARHNLPKSSPVSFFRADLAAPGWGKELAGSRFDAVLAFAVLHHIPGADLRRDILRQVRQLLKEDGCFIHSEWQFLNSPRLRARIQPWESIGMQAEQVDPGDYLIDWRRGGLGYRYVHLFTPDELAALARDTGFRIVEEFYSDGEEGKLGLYQIWKIV